ncbi:MAG: putative ABC exporter domain-containing protein [Dehalobacterium sp.]
MSSLTFLLIQSAKNNFFELLRKPAKLIMWIFLIAMIMGMVILSFFTGKTVENFQDIIWLKGITFLLILLFVVIAVQKGLSNGDVIFDMNDVNLLFVSPVNSRLILMYGIVKMAKMSFLAGFFILFQSNSFKTGFGLGFDAVLLTLLGFILAMSLLQIISLLIYSLTNGKPKRKMVVRMIAVAVFLPLITTLGIQFLGTSDPMTALENTLRSPIFAWTPIAGWAPEGIVALISGDVANGFLFLGLNVLVGALLIFYIALSNPDYYEDVLVASETAFEKKRVVAEGQVNTEASSTRKVKVSKTGINGLGSNSIFYKHLRESFRANRFGLWGLQSVVTVAGAAIFASFMPRDAGGIITILQILMWIQIYMIGSGRGLKELYSHYIYLIPESSFRKIVWSNLEIAFKVLVESIAIFGVSGLVMGENVLLIILTIVVYTLFSFLLLGINYVSMRWTGADISVGMLMILYTFAVIIIMLPGLVAAIALGSMIEGIGVLIGMGVLALWELIAGLGCFALSKGILHNCDMPVLRTGK